MEGTELIRVPFGKDPVNLGDYDELVAGGQTSFGIKNRVNRYGCEWESLVDNNTDAPAVWDGGDTITPSNNWKLNAGNPDAWLMSLDKPASTGTTGDYPYNGLGRIVLKKKYSENSDYANQPILEQADFDDEDNNHLTNTVFVIKYDFVLTEPITLGAGCSLDFEGGSITTSYPITLQENTLVENGRITVNGCSAFIYTGSNTVIRNCEVTQLQDNVPTYLIKEQITTANKNYLKVEGNVCNNLGIAYVDGNSSYKTRNIEVINNYCSINRTASSVQGNTPQGIMLSFCEDVIVHGNNIKGASDSIVLRAGDGKVAGWIDLNTMTVNFGGKNGIVTDNIITNPLMSGIYTDLWENVLVANNTIIDCPHEGLDAEWSKNITFDNNTVYGWDPLTVFSYRDNIVFSNNNIYPSSVGDDSFIFRFGGPDTSQGEVWYGYEESKPIWGKIIFKGNHVYATNSKSRMFGADYGDVEIVDNYIENFHMDTGQNAPDRFVVRGNHFKTNRQPSGTFLYCRNKTVIEDNTFVCDNSVQFNFNPIDGSKSIVRNNKFNIALVNDALFRTDAFDVTADIIFENNILDDRLKNQQYDPEPRVGGGIFAYPAGWEGYLTNSRLLYKNNIWHDSMKDVLSESSEFKTRTEYHCPFAESSIIRKNEAVTDGTVIESYCTTGGIGGQVGTVVWKDVVVS